MFENVALSDTPIDLHTLDKFSFTFRSSRSQIRGGGASYCCFRKFAFRNLLSENCCFCLLPPLQKAPVIAAIAKLFQTTSSRNLISIYANLLQHFIFAHFLLTEGYGKCALRKEPFVAPSVERFKTATLRKADR